MPFSNSDVYLDEASKKTFSRPGRNGTERKKKEAGSKKKWEVGASAK